jgi:uncharacterized membrane protein
MLARLKIRVVTENGVIQENKMKLSILSACAAVLLMSVSAQAATECRSPMEPDIPARFETEEELMSVYSEVKDFIVTKSPEFLECLDVMRAEIDQEADDAAAKEAAIDQQHNDNVDAQTAVKERFDVAHAIWKKENSKK